MRLTIALAALFLAAPAPAAASPWAAPVAGEITRVFDPGANPFEAGRHRGVDFAAPAGAPVRATCGGVVVVAGRVGSSGGVVTIRCGAWRVSHLPLATVGARVRVGGAVRRGHLIGTAAGGAGHAGLHLGARREGDRFGYTDPLRFLGADPRHPPAPPIGPGSRERRYPARPPTPRPGMPPSRALVRSPASPAGSSPIASHHRAPASPSGSSPIASRHRDPLAPWPVWAGLALVLAGAGGAALRRRPGPRRRPLARAAVERVR